MKNFSDLFDGTNIKEGKSIKQYIGYGGKEGLLTKLKTTEKVTINNN